MPNFGKKNIPAENGLIDLQPTLVIWNHPYWAILHRFGLFKQIFLAKASFRLKF